MSKLPKNIRPGDRTGEFVITPDAGKWYLVIAGAVLFALVKTSVAATGFEWLLAAAVAAFAWGMANGKLAWVRVGRDGLEYRHAFQRKSYAWEDVSEFKFKSYGIGWNRQEMVVFSHRNKTGAWANVSKFMAGGTESMPVIGLPAEQLVRILNKARAEYADPMKTAPDPIMSHSRQPAPQPIFRAPKPSKPAPVSLEAPRVVRQPRTQSPNPSSRNPIDSRQKPLIS